jgi:hypothetical protein
MSRKAIGGFVLSTLILLCVPSQAEETQVKIIRPPPLAMEMSRPRFRDIYESHEDTTVNQAVAVTIITVANPYVGDRYRRWDNPNPRRIYTGYGLWGGTAVYSGPRYPF